LVVIALNQAATAEGMEKHISSEVISELGFNVTVSSPGPKLHFRSEPSSYPFPSFARSTPKTETKGDGAVHAKVSMLMSSGDSLPFR
jgi:hypothetical protein